MDTEKTNIGAGESSPPTAGCACVLTDEQKAEIKRQVDKDFAEQQEWLEKFIEMNNSEIGDELSRLTGVLWRRRIISPRAFSLLIDVQCRMQKPTNCKRVRHNKGVTGAGTASRARGVGQEVEL